MNLRMLLLASVCAALPVTAVMAAVPVKVEGRLVEGTAENGLAVYRGIPFAAPPSVTCAGEPRNRPPDGRVCCGPKSSAPGACRAGRRLPI